VKGDIKCKRCGAKIGGHLRDPFDIASIPFDGKTKASSIESFREQLCKECYEAMNEKKE
jgi:hypothetical protein